MRWDAPGCETRRSQLGTDIAHDPPHYSVDLFPQSLGSFGGLSVSRRKGPGPAKVARPSDSMLGLIWGDRRGEASTCRTVHSDCRWRRGRFFGGGSDGMRLGGKIGPAPNTGERTREAYVIERELADRLRAADREQRPRVAQEVYADLYRRVRWHPDLTRSAEERDRYSAAVAYSYERWMGDVESVLEIGSGGCDVLRKVGRRFPTTRFVALDVAREPVEASNEPLPPNVTFVQGGVAAIPFPPAAFDFVFCSQVLEHFHPDDVADHISEVARVVKPGGWFALDTPNRISGPHDISRGFTREATGLHLKEWTHQELVELLVQRGFDKVTSRLVPGRISRLLRLRSPGPLIDARFKARVERVVSTVGHSALRRWMAKCGGVDGIFLYAHRAET